MGCWISTDDRGAVLLGSIFGAYSHPTADLKVPFGSASAEMRNLGVLSLVVGLVEEAVELHAWLLR